MRGKNFTPLLSTFPRLWGGMSSAPGKDILGSGEGHPRLRGGSCSPEPGISVKNRLNSAWG
uniref:hypothetical protein n=1 Tax=Bacteroides nordii TaxID=291645 RepID=UPI002A90A4D3|nr:hypothetical protein [Bacteroides nordii]